MAIQVRIERAGMEQRGFSLIDDSDGVGEKVDLPIDERTRRLSTYRDIDLNADNLRWVSNYRDWNDVLRDCLQLVNKPLNLLKRLVG